MAECANKGCTQSPDVVVPFVDPVELESYCRTCGRYEYENNEHAIAVADLNTTAAEAITDLEDYSND